MNHYINFFTTLKFKSLAYKEDEIKFKIILDKLMAECEKAIKQDETEASIKIDKNNYHTYMYEIKSPFNIRDADNYLGQFAIFLEKYYNLKTDVFYYDWDKNKEEHNCELTISLNNEKV